MRNEKIFHRICVVSVCLVLISCASITGKRSGTFWGGSKAFEKRQTIEAYKRDTVPMIEKFLAGVKHLANNSERDRSFFIPWKMFDRHLEYLEKGTSSLEDISRVVTNVPVKGEK